MNISTISMAIFHSKLLVITRPGTIDTFKHRLLHLRSCDLLGAWHKGGQLRHDEGGSGLRAEKRRKTVGKWASTMDAAGYPKILEAYIYNIYI